MSDLRNTIVTWTDQYMDEILAAPLMWGSLEAVEMQILQLLEVRAMALRPTQERVNPRRVIDTYNAFLRDRYPGRPSSALSNLVGRLDDSEATFVTLINEFRDMMVRAVLPENPFAHSQLAVRLTFEIGR